MELTSFQSEGEDGEDLEVGVVAHNGGVLVEEKGVTVVGDDRIDEGSDLEASCSPELRITLWALTCRSSLVARVTSMMSAGALASSGAGGETSARVVPWWSAARCRR